MIDALQFYRYISVEFTVLASVMGLLACLCIWHWVDVQTGMEWLPTQDQNSNVTGQQRHKTNQPTNQPTNQSFYRREHITDLCFCLNGLPCLSIN
jgi:hypothetical protein